MRKRIGSIILAVGILLAWMPDTVMAARMERKPTTVSISQVMGRTKTQERAEQSDNTNVGEDVSEDVDKSTAVLPEGSGTETDPYRIQDAEQLRLFADMVNGVEGSADSGLCAVLAKDIDLSAVCGEGIGSWTPIGTKASPYKGIFDGASFVVGGLYYDSPSGSRAGLFGCNAGVIRNLGVAGRVTAGSYTGGLCGVNTGSITGCYSAAAVTGDRYTGGICGYNDGGSINVCYNTGAVSGSKYVGGIGGYNKNMVADCYNTAAVDGSGTSIGGVCGYNKKTVSNCYNTGEVTGRGAEYIGSVCGYNHSASTFLNSYYLITGTEKGNYGIGLTRERFVSGEACWLLNGERSEDVVWHQTCGEGFPNFGGKTVYQVQAYRNNGGTQELVSWYTNDKNKSGMQTYTAAAAEETSGGDTDGVFSSYSENSLEAGSDGSKEEHDYKKPEWKWKEYEEAEAVFVCRECEEKVTRKASVKETVTAATCTADGKIVYTASVKLDGKNYRDSRTVVIAKLGHRPFERVAVKAATCEETGIKRECWICPACKQYFGDQAGTAALVESDVVQPALGHDFAAGAWEWAKDYSTANVNFSCRNCGKTETRQGSVSHETTASCTVPGKTTYTATVMYNGREYQDNRTVEGEMLPHKYSGEPKWEWSSDKSTATAVFSCDYECGTTQKEQGTVEISAETATCTVPGDTVYTATVTYNGRKYQTTEIVEGKTLPHKYSGEPKWEWSDDKSTATAIFSCEYDCGTEKKETGKIEVKTGTATCTVPGDTVYTATATFNGKEYVDTETVEGETVPHKCVGKPNPTDWKWTGLNSEEDVTAAVVFKCAYGCGEPVKRDAVITGSVIKRVATCTEKGEIEYTAVVKDDDGNEWEGKETKETSASHIMEKHEEEPATCGKAGKKEHWQCSVCKNLFSDGEGTTSITEADIVIPETGEHHLVKENNGRFVCKDCGREFIYATTSDGRTVLYSLEGDTAVIWEPEESWEEGGLRQADRQDAQAERKAQTEQEKQDAPAGDASQGSQTEGKESEIQDGQTDRENQDTLSEQPGQTNQETPETLSGQLEQENPESQNNQLEEKILEELPSQPQQAGTETPAVTTESAGQTEQSESVEQTGPAEQTEPAEPTEQPEPIMSEETVEEDAMQSDAGEESLVNLRAGSAANDAAQGQEQGEQSALGIPIAALAAFTGILLLLILRRKESTR